MRKSQGTSSSGSLNGWGKRVGLWTYCYENNTKKAEGEFKGGSREGLWTFWDENGKKESEREYKDGEEVRRTDF